jgi:phosphoglycerate dehydrogenase-like enzyme
VTGAAAPIRVAFVGGFAACFVEPVRARLTLPCDVVVADEREILARLPEVDVLVGMTFTPAMGAAASRLRLVQVPGAGTDRIDRAALPAGTSLANAYGHEAGIAEYVLGAMLAWNRGFGRLDASLRRGRWEAAWSHDAPPPPTAPELAGKTLAILGYGRIGRAVARRARAFDMTVHAIRREPRGTSAEGLAFLGGPESLSQLLREADYLAITLALTPETRGMLGARELALMKPTAMLVNVARGEIVDEDALYRALADGTIAGAALDVWYRYPTAPGPTLPATRPFHELPNVLMTPHVSGWTEGMLAARAAVIAGNIERVARGEPPLNPVSA